MGRVSRKLLATLLAGLTPSAAFANPTGGVVQGGNATIAGQGTSTVTINQTSNAAVLSWQQFNIQQGETTNFVQPGARAIALNRILDGQASQILGNLNANGRVYLINPNGILFGQSAVVNVGGLAAATNAQVTGLVDSNLNALASAQGAPGAAITNQGHINVAPGGDVYLVGAKVENSATGAIHVENGVVKVASGATLVLAGEDGIAVEFQVPTTPDNTAVNLGTIVADKGIVDIRASIVRQAGTVQASAAVEREGQIVLVGDSEVHVEGNTTTDNGNITVTATAGDVTIGTGGNVVSHTGDVDVEAGRDVTFTSTDKNNDSVIESGGGNVRVVAERDVNLQPDVNAAGNTAIRTRGIDVTTTDDQGQEHQLHEKGDGGNVTVIARTGNVNSGTADRWVDSAPGLDRGILNLFGVPYPEGYDPIPVDPRGILGIGSEAGGNVTVIAGGNVSTRRTDISVARTGGSATATPSFDPDQPLPIDYDGSHIGVIGQAYETVQLPLSDVSSVRVPLADAPKAKLTVIAGGDIGGDYMIRNGTATLRAGYKVDDATADQIAADPSALAAIEAQPPAQRQIQISDAANADPSRGWLGGLGNPLTVDMAFASVDGRGANGVALRAAENPSLVYPAANGSGVGTQKLPLYGDGDSLTLDAERGDVVLLGTDDVIRENGNTSTTKSNAFVHALPPNVTITTHDFTRGQESRGGDLVLLSDFTMLPSESGRLSLDVAGKVRTANPLAAGSAGGLLTIESFGSAGDQNFTLPNGLKLKDTQTGVEYTLDQPVAMQTRAVPVPAHGDVTFTLTPTALEKGTTIPSGTEVRTADGKTYHTTSDLVIPPPAQRQRQTEIQFTFDPPPKTNLSLIADRTTRLVGPDGATYTLDKTNILVSAGQTRLTVTATADLAGGKDLRPNQLKLETPIAGMQATNLTVSTRVTVTRTAVVSDLPGSQGTILDHQIIGLVTPIAAVAGVTNPKAIGGTDAGEFGTTTGGIAPQATVVGVIGPAGRPPFGSTLVVEPGQTLPPGINASDIVILSQSPANRTDSLIPGVFRQLQVQRNDAGEVVSTRVDGAAGEVVVADASQVWTATQAPTNPTAHITQSKASPNIDQRGGNVFDYAQYYALCKSGAQCVVTDQTGNPIKIGDGPTHVGSDPAVLLAHGGFDRIGFDLAQAATVWSGADVVDLQLKTQHTSASDLTQIVVPNGDVRLGAGTETLIDNQTGSPIQVPLQDDPSSGLLVSGPGRARILVGVAPHVTPIEGFDGPLADLVPAPVDPQDNGITLADWKGSQAAFQGLDERGKPVGTGDGKLTNSEAPWVPTGAGGKLELNDVGGDQSLGLLTSGNASNPALPHGGATLDVVTAGDINLHRFGAVGTIQGGDLTVESVGGQITADEPPDTFLRQRGFFTLNANVVGAGAENQPTGGGNISIDADGDVNAGGSAFATLSSSNIKIETRNASITAGTRTKFGTVAVSFDAVSGTPAVTYAGSGFFASGNGVIRLNARKDINLGAGIRARGIVLNAGGNVVAGTGAAQAQNISIDAGGTISGSFSATSISIGSGTLSGSATVSAGVVSGGGGAVSNTGANQVSAGSVVAGTTPQATQNLTEQAAGQANSGLRSVVIDVSSKPCDSPDCQ